MAMQRQRGSGGGSGSGGAPVPRDMPDQQARRGADPWDVATRPPAGDEPEEDTAPDPGDETAPDQDEQAVPDPDEAGSGPSGAPRAGTVHPEHPAPQEPSD
ncbi:hypothetical protein [Streptomyces echinatus]|uniref:Uncharacterized protein n=2 Tax=Streptomyces echinatus TaxID=67293 RepID=A0A7W9PV45_9ACTN|nr:hypothetical protein [Streptomyces echinatus]MBB5928466.1 hypothetical protein [Streptomyces echinatus]